jgi:hypothetical protein
VIDERRALSLCPIAFGHKHICWLIDKQEKNYHLTIFFICNHFQAPGQTCPATTRKQRYGDMTSISAERIFRPGSFPAVKTGGIIWIAYDPTLDFHS